MNFDFDTMLLSFSIVDTIDLNDLLNEKLPKIRCSNITKHIILSFIVSQITRLKERGIYHPFTDDNEISNEIPLMHIIAENIIIKSAEQS